MAPSQEHCGCSKLHRLLLVLLVPLVEPRHFREQNQRLGVQVFFSLPLPLVDVLVTPALLRISKQLALRSNVSRIRRDTYFHMLF